MRQARRRWTAANMLVLASLACAVAVGAVAALESTLDGDGGPRWPLLWWTAYGLFFLTLVIVHRRLSKARAVNIPLSALVTLACTLMLLHPHQVWGASLLVLTATLASFSWSGRSVGVLIVAQAAVIAITGVLGNWPAIELVVAVLGFGNLQVVAALVVFAIRGEEEARRELSLVLEELNTTSLALERRTRETERLRISRDLHDVAGHQLTALALELEVAQHLTSGTDRGTHVLRANSIAKDLLTTVRVAVGEMREQPSSLQAGLAQIAEGAPGVDVVVKIDEELRVDAEQTVALLRCAQEAVTNVLRHSDATTMRVVVAADDDTIRLTASDDGSRSDVVPGIGLTGMAERFDSLGGGSTSSRPRTEG